MENLLEVLLFYLFAGVACGGALGVALGRDIVRCLLSLVLTLGAVGGLFFTAGAALVGVIQILLYLGGTVVVLIFGVMLTSPHVQPQLETGLKEKVLAATVCMALFGILMGTGYWIFAHPLAESGSQVISTPAGGLSETEAVAASLLGLRVLPSEETRTSGASPGFHCLLAFEVVSIHLLVVLVAAAYFARARRPRLPE